MLDANWSSDFSMNTVLLNVQALLSEPEWTSPIDSVLGELSLTNKENYLSRAAASVRSLTLVTFAAACAAQGGGDLGGGGGAGAGAGSGAGSSSRKRAAPDSTDASVSVPQELTCPLTRTLFVNPVRTAEGFVYEHSALVELKKSSGLDPNTGSVIDLDSTTSASDIKLRADKLRESLTN